MNHPDEQELVSYLTGDESSGAIEHHLDGCPECAGRAARLRAVLEMTRAQPVPEPDEGFEARIWARQRAELERSGRIRMSEVAEHRTVVPMPWLNPRRWALVGAMAAALAIAFVLGLYTPPPGTTSPPAEPQREERALLVALGAHLERTRTVLLEVSNSSVAQVSTLARQADRARELIGDNRLYRQSARIAGLPEYASLLDEIERVLLELARGSNQPIGPDKLRWLRERISAGDLLFRSRVLQANTRPGALPTTVSGAAGPVA